MAAYYTDITAEEEAQLPLPPSWSKIMTDEGEPSYKDAAGRRHVEHPLIAKARLSLQNDELPPGWRAHRAKVDGGGDASEVYFSNQSLNITMCKCSPPL